MKKRFLSVSLAVCMACLLTMTSCSAAEVPASSDKMGTESTVLTSSAQGTSEFTDVPAGAGYAQAVEWCREQGLMAGVGGSRFDPEGTLTRAMLATVLYRAAGRPSTDTQSQFTDAIKGEWYYDAVTWADAGGYMKGYGSGLFGTNDPVSMEQLEVILGRYTGSGPAWTGDPAKAQTATRAQVAVALYNALKDRSEEPVRETSRTLVAYFSATNTTRPLAEYAADILNADLYEIVPEDPYTDADLAYYTNGRADREQNDPSARPAISGSVDNMAGYDVVFLGYPIWHGQAPRIISTFLESYDFSGKTLVPFCTSHSSGIGSSDTNLHALASGANWLSGRRFAAGTTHETMETWIEGLDLPKEEEVTENPGKFDLAAKSVTLNSGYIMPINGLGTYSLHGDECISSVKAALKSGVRLFDTASAYGNEKEVGQAIREGMEELGIKREEIFVITKIYPGSEMADPETSIQACLDRLDLGYVDMMLLHHPDSNDVKAYKVMEKFVEDGKIRSLGLSNWYVKELESFLPQVTIKPALVQNEIHPYYQENDVIPYIQEQGITVQGWYPLGGRGHTGELLGDDVISAIAEAHGVSSAQVILRWNLQKGVVVIPGSSNPDHIKENTELYGFTLTDVEMEQINALDRNEKHVWY